MLKITQPDNQLCSLTCLYLHAHIKYLYIYPIKSQKKRIVLNELSELEYLKTPSQKSSYAHWHARTFPLIDPYYFLLHIWHFLSAIFLANYVLKRATLVVWINRNWIYNGKESENKAGYTATLVACGWAGAVVEKVTGEQWAQNVQQVAQGQYVVSDTSCPALHDLEME